jgi:hypothetical protein
MLSDAIVGNKIFYFLKTPNDFSFTLKRDPSVFGVKKGFNKRVESLLKPFLFPLKLRFSSKTKRRLYALYA